MKKILSVLLSVICFTTISVCAFATEEFPVEIKAKSAILMDVDSGKVLMKYNECEKLPPASVTKIMPLLLFCEAIDDGKISLNDTVTASSEAASKGGSQIWLKEGEKMSVDDLLKAVAVGSANDACCALSEYVAGSEKEFVNLMNKRAKELNMTNSVFYNCSGLDDEDTNVTCARDIAIMSCELMKHEIIQKYTCIWMDSLRNGQTQLVNTNKLVRFYQGTTGLKTGTTNKAGCCLSATAKRENLHLCAVVLGSDNSTDRFETAKAMLNWGFSNYVSVKPVIEKNLITPVKVIMGEKKSVIPLVPTVDSIIVKKGEENNLKQTISLSLDVDSPLEKGQVLGTIKFSYKNEEIKTYDLVSPESVNRISFAFAFKRFLHNLSA